MKVVLNSIPSAAKTAAINIKKKIVKVERIVCLTLFVQFNSEQFYYGIF
jgi:hypothetical protein